MSSDEDDNAAVFMPLTTEHHPFHAYPQHNHQMRSPSLTTATTAAGAPHALPGIPYQQHQQQGGDLMSVLMTLTMMHQHGGGASGGASHTVEDRRLLVAQGPLARFSQRQFDALVALYEEEDKDGTSTASGRRAGPQLGEEQRLVALSVREQLVDLFFANDNAHSLFSREIISEKLNKLSLSQSRAVDDGRPDSADTGTVSTARYVGGHSASELLVNTIITAAFIRLGDRQQSKEFLQRSLNSLEYLIDEPPNRETASALVTLSIICILERESFQKIILYNQLAFEMAQKLYTKKSHPLYQVTWTSSICSRILHIYDQFQMLRLFIHLIPDPSRDRSAMETYLSIMGKRSHEVTMTQIHKCVGPVEKGLFQGEKSPEFEAHEDMSCTTLLYSYMLDLVLSRYVASSEERIVIIAGIKYKLKPLEDYLSSAACPRKQSKRNYHKFAIAVLRAEISDRTGRSMLAKEWADKAIGMITDDAFLRWPPYVIPFFPNLVATVAKNRFWGRLQLVWERVTLLSQEFHILEPLCDDTSSVLQQHSVMGPSQIGHNFTL